MATSTVGGCSSGGGGGGRLLLATATFGLTLLLLFSGVDLAEGRTCPSTDVRNTVDNLREKLEGCTVIEGSLYVVLIENANESHFDNLSFPQLREITGHLLFYRVFGLRSLGQLFPNLAVIRGNHLFMNFALVIYEMTQLQEVGLFNLTAIVRGSAWIVKNPNLCYVDTIDWQAITEMGVTVLDNKPPHLCPRCTSHCEHCWNGSRCQTKAIAADCHPLCLAGCFGPTASDCYACNGVFTLENECAKECPKGTYRWLDRRCILLETCYNKTTTRLPILMKYSERINWFIFNGSCVQECPDGFEMFKGSYGSSCRKCLGRCKKSCDGGNIDTLSAAQNLSGCTHISGSLEITIRTGKHKIIQQELEKSLSSIEEIEGYLKVARTFPLVSLSFLKNLRVIHGKYLENKKSFLILENKNLQELWDWDSRPEGMKLQILKGTVFFHYNPKLCLSTIKRFIEEINYTNKVSLLDISNESNGDKFACTSINLNVKVHFKYNESVILFIDRPKKMAKQFEVLRYIVYYVKSPDQNMTFEEPDECGDYGWKTKDISPQFQSPNGSVTYPLTHLEPDTQYAFYVKTYTVDSVGGQSAMQYFRTLPSKPSFPIDLNGFSETSSDITVKWKQPSQANGVLEEYIVLGFKHEVDEEFLLQRDFCKSPINREATTTATTKLPDLRSNNNSNNANTSRNKLEDEKCCKDGGNKNELVVPKCTSSSSSSSGDGLQKLCDHSEQHKYLPLAEHENVHNCEKYIYTILHKRPFVVFETDNKSKDVSDDSKEVEEEHTGKRESIMRKFPTFDNKNQYLNVENTLGPLYKDTDYDVKDKKNRVVTFLKHVPANTTATKIQNLDHFAEYTIEVRACRKIDPQESAESMLLHNRCSYASITTVRTKKNITADAIPMPVAHRVNNKTVEIAWEKPSNPNGVVVSYLIEYRRTDISNSKPILDCITPAEYYDNLKKGYNYLLQDLPPGRYAYRLQALSMASESEYTKLFSFVVEEKFSLSVQFVVFCSVALIFMVLGMIMLGYYWRKKPTLEELRLFADVNPEYSSVHKYVEDHWELPRENVKILQELGQGTFGMVYQGLLQPDEISCAVKTMNENATECDYYEFLNEASIMKSFYEAHHVVKLFGVVSKGTPPLVVMELMVLGDLKMYLRGTRESCEHPPPSERVVVQMAAQIADGMAYLEARKFVHRDLAARNCMVSADLTVKIGDFGMTRDIYETDYYRKGNTGLLPIRWMAPESLNDGVFSSLSDVWSYGVVLWEIAMLAEQPYQGMSNEQVLQYVIGGNRLKMPLFCTEALKPIMLSCWRRKPAHRPTFLQIVGQLEARTDEVFKMVSFYNSAEAADLRQHAKNNANNQNKPPLFARSVQEESRIQLLASTSAGSTPGPSQTSSSVHPNAAQQNPNDSLNIDLTPRTSALPVTANLSRCKLSNGQALFTK